MRAKNIDNRINILDVSKGGGGGVVAVVVVVVGGVGWGGGRSREKRKIDVSCGQNRYVRLP